MSVSLPLTAKSVLGRVGLFPAISFLVLLGCAKEQDYVEVMQHQQAAFKEMTEILKTVKDEATMADARRALDRNAERYAAISEKANALPKPPPKKVQERLREESFAMKRIFDDLRKETERIGQLPGGPQFLKRFESTRGLLSAVQP